MIGLALHLLLVGGSAVVVLMFFLWLIHIFTKNAAIVDVGWACGLAMLSAIYATLGHAWPLRAVLVAGMGCIWGLRLGGYLLLTRVIGRPEEGRYVQLRKDWKSNVTAKFLAFFEFQALLCVVLSGPFMFPAINNRPHLSWIEFAGCGIWLVGMIGEAAADAQLNQFKKNSLNEGKTCRVGLWNYSRHPNYFFESVIWIGFAVFALASPYGFIGLIAPALILYFLLRVTGIPATEAQALRTKHDDYRDYQRTTSAFIPWFHKKTRASAVAT